MITTTTIPIIKAPEEYTKCGTKFRNPSVRSIIPWLYSGGIFDWDNALKRLDTLNQLAEAPDLWNDQQRAQVLLQERTRLEQSILQCNTLEQELSDNIALIELGEAEDDQAIVTEAETAIQVLARQAKTMEVECLFSGEADANDCFLEIHAGAGGTDSQDWAEMLFRMYNRWAEKHRFKWEIISEIAGEEAGLKSVTLKIHGHNAYGWAKTESGVHRLVRISPFNSAGKRQTSFASVWVFPVLDNSIAIDINEKDLRVDTFRSSGAGGQHVNTTDSAVRITHLPTNIVVQCQNNRSQHRNKAEALSMLQSRLYELELQKREAAAEATNASKTDNSWGHQIRSYVLHPYQLVKDLRTGVETSATSEVLDGDLDKFITAALSARISGEGLSVTEADDDL